MEGYNICPRVYIKKKRYSRSIPVYEADFGFVRYSLSMGGHKYHRRRNSYGCYNELVIFNKIINDRAQKLMEFHSYHLAVYFWRILNHKSANYALHLLRGVSVHSPAYAKDVYTLSLASSEYTNKKFVDLEKMHRIKVEVLPVPEGFPGHGREVVLAGFHRDLDYFVGPAVVIPVQAQMHEQALEKPLAAFLVSAAAGLAKAAALHDLLMKQHVS